MTLNEVIDTLQTWIRNADDEYDREEMGRVAGLKEALHEIKRIEPQEPKIGHWKYIGNGHNGLFKCDKCGAHRNMFDELEKYCYSCGAKMAEEWR